MNSNTMNMLAMASGMRHVARRQPTHAERIRATFPEHERRIVHPYDTSKWPVVGQNGEVK